MAGVSQPRSEAGERPFCDQKRCHGAALEGEHLKRVDILAFYNEIHTALLFVQLQIIDGTPASLNKIKSISKELLRLKLVVQNEVRW